MATSYSRQKSYADNRKWLLEFYIGDMVYFKISPTKGVMRFGRKMNSSIRYARSYEILHCMGEVAYELTLHAEVVFAHPIIHVSILNMT